jgi:RepB DNA-primase from phage plasmid
MQSEDKRSLIPSETPKGAGRKSSLGAVEYIERNYEPSDRLAIVVRNRQTGETTQRLASAEKIASPDFQAWLRHKNARGADIYISQNAFRSEARIRSKADVDKIRHIYLDLDKNGEESLAKIRDSSLVPEPSFVISTSPHRYQAIWKVADMAPNAAETLQKAMAAEFGGDPAATDSSRVLRLPGFQNKKYHRDYPVEAYAGSDQTYISPDFRIPADDRQSESRPLDETKKKHGRQSGEMTQSERDWAYVKQQLRRGEAPERLIETLTHFRQDKSSPDYYARQTVSRAYVSVALGRGDKPIEIEQKVVQLATHQPHPATYARQTIAEMKSEKQKITRETEQPGREFRVP